MGEFKLANQKLMILMRILSTNDDENGETDSKVNPKYIKQFWGSNSGLPFLPKKIVISK